MNKIRITSFLILGFVVIVRLALAVSEDELQNLDEKTKRYVLSEQKRIEEEAKARASEEAETMRRKETVFDWALGRKIKVLRQGGPFPEGIDEALVKEMLYAELAQSYSEKWKENPDGLMGLREQMEELRPYILDLGKSQNPPDRSYAVKFGKYLKVDEELESMLYAVLDRKLAEDESGVRETLDVIFGYGMDSRRLRDELVQGLALDEKVSSESRFGKEAELAAGEWGLSEAAENLMRLVEEQYERTGDINRTAVKSLQKLGGDAAEVLQHLKIVLEQALSDEDADFREIESLKYAISAIENDLGQKQRPVASSVYDLSKEVEAPPEPEPSVQEPVEAMAAELPPEPAEETSRWWLWMLGALAVIGGLFAIFRRKQ